MLNTEHFVLLAGNREKWDPEMRQRATAGEAVYDIQLDQHDLGRRGAILVAGVYGWYVRATTSLQEPSILENTGIRGGSLDGSQAEAIAWGKAWAEADPTNREFVARKADLWEGK